MQKLEWLIWRPHLAIIAGYVLLDSVGSNVSTRSSTEFFSLVNVLYFYAVKLDRSKDSIYVILEVTAFINGLQKKGTLEFEKN